MRALCTCVASTGRFRTVAPLAEALSRSGHEVLFAAPAAFHPEIHEAGLRTIQAGLTISEARVIAERECTDFARLRPDEQASVLFTDVSPRHLYCDLISVARSWQPHVILHEEGEFAGPIVAAVLGVPVIRVLWPSPTRSARMAAILNVALSQLCDRLGLMQADLEHTTRCLTLDQCPPSLQQRDNSVVTHRLAIRPFVYISKAHDDVPKWYRKVRGSTTVYATLGTVPAFNSSRETFRSIVTAMKDDHFRLLLTVGSNNDPLTVLGGSDKPGHIDVRTFMSQHQILPSTDVVICHGGSGTTIGALSFGIPILFLPRGGAAQYRMAEACRDFGVGLILRSIEVQSEAVRCAVEELRETESYSIAGERIAQEIAAMPGMECAVDAIQRFVK